MRVLDHVGQRLLHDPVGRQVDARGQLAMLAKAAHVDPHARARGPRDQPVQLGQPWRGKQRRARGRRGQLMTGHRRPARIGVVGLPERTQHPAHLVQRLAAGGLDGAERVPGVTGLAVDHVLTVARLDRDHAHAVCDHVVQFPCDAQPLLRHRLAGRLVLQPDRVPAALAHAIPARPGDDHAEHDRDHGAAVSWAAIAEYLHRGDGHQGHVHRHRHPHRVPLRLVGGRDQVQHVGDGQEVGQRAGVGDGQRADQEDADQQDAEHEHRMAAAQRHRDARRQHQQRGGRPGQSRRPVAYDAGAQRQRNWCQTTPDLHEQDQRGERAGQVV